MNIRCISVPASVLKNASWFKSSYSNAGGDCIEVAGLPNHIAVRDSKKPDGPALILSADGWSAFASAVKGGQLPA